MTSLISRLETHAAQPTCEPRLVFLFEADAPRTSCSYRDLRDGALDIACGLRADHAGGDRVVVACASPRSFLETFLGCLYAGVIPVPAAPPRLRTGGSDRIAGIARDCGARTVVVDAPRPAEGLAAAPAPRWVRLDDLRGTGRPAPAHRAAADDVAFLQYTSGSTSEPRGVAVTHANLLANFHAIAGAMGIAPETRFLSWLPLHHDMGLIGMALQALHLGAPLILMPPGRFLQRPLRWLEAIDEHRANLSGAPNFAYELLVKASGEEDRRRLDLRSWTTAFNGAEPIRADTFEAFAAAFRGSGLPRDSLFPCYGLAEATLYVAGARRSPGHLSRTFDSESLKAGRARAVSDAGATALVGCGAVPPEHDVRIVDPERRSPLEDGRVGEIWVCGPSVAQEYWGAPGLSTAVLRARLPDDPRPYLRTGDLGFRLEGELFVTGRLKDLIILRGRNIHPHDVELTARAALDAPPGSGAAFSEGGIGAQGLTLVQEVRLRASDDPLAVVRRVCVAIAREHDVAPDRIVLIAPGRLLRTTSGKVRREANRIAFAAPDAPVILDHRGGLPAAYAHDA